MRSVALALLGVVLLATAPVTHSASAPAAWVVFVDDLHLDFRNTGRLRDLVRKVVTEVVGPDDLMTLRASGPSQIGGDLGSRDFYRPQVSRVTGNGLREDDLLRSDRATVAEIDERFRRTMRGVVGAIGAFESAGHTPRGLILISNGYARDVLATAEGQALLDQVLRHSVKVFAISGRFIESLDMLLAADPDQWAVHQEAERNSLRDLAERTSGFAIITAYELPNALLRIRVE